MQQRALYKGPALSGAASYKFPAVKTVANMEAAGREVASIHDRRARDGADIVGLQELVTYGVKGFAAYAHHALGLGKTSAAVYDNVYSALAATAAANPTADFLLGAALKVGAANYEAMQLLDAGHVANLGVPSPTNVSTMFAGR